jgi:hypothetical protein
MAGVVLALDGRGSRGCFQRGGASVWVQREGCISRVSQQKGGVVPLRGWMVG